MTDSNRKVFRISRRDSIATIKVLAPVIFILLAAVSFHDFVIHAILANIVINTGIVLTGIYGVILILLRLRSAQDDFSVIERFGTEAKAGVPMNLLLEEPWLKRKYVRHYLTHIAQTGGMVSSQLDQHAIESELNALNEEYESKLELPQFIVGFMIAMGLLGTFIGLLETLTGISGMLDGLGGTGDVSAQFSKLIGELKKPLAGMGIAFSASMFGLIASLMLAIMMTNLRRYINRVMAIARNVMHDLIKLSRPAPGAGMYQDNRADGSRGLDFAGSNSLLASRIDLLVKKIELLMESFEGSIAGTQKLNDLLGFGPRMKEISERTLDEIRSMNLACVEQQQLMNRMIESNGDIGKNIVNLFEMQRQTKEIGEKSLETLKMITSGQSEHGRLSQKLIDVCGDVVKTINASIDVQRQAKETGERNVDGLRVIASSQSEHNLILQKLIDLNADVLRVAEGTLDVHRQSEAVQVETLGEIKSIVSLGNEQRQIGQNMVTGLENIVRAEDNSTSSNKLVSGEVVSALRKLDERLGKVEEIELGEARHLWAIKESLTKLGQSLGIIELVSTGVGQQTMLLEALVGEVRNSQNTLYAIQQNLHRNTGSQ